MKNIDARLGEVLFLGREGENKARRITFNLRSWRNQYGPGTAVLLAQRPGEKQPYPVALDETEYGVSWTVTAADVAIPGRYGKCELQYRVNDTIVKSDTWQTLVLEALGKAGETPPEPEQGWVDEVLQAGVEAQEAAKDASERAKDAGQAAQAAETARDGAEGHRTAADKSAEAAAQSAQEAQNAADTAAKDAVQEAEKELSGYVDTAKQYSGKPPIIRNGTWWTWDAAAQKYVDTGEEARGEDAVLPEHLIVGEEFGETPVPLLTDADLLGGKAPAYYTAYTEEQVSAALTDGWAIADSWEAYY